MSVPNQVPLTVHVGNGITKAFVFQFLLLKDSDAQVTVDGAPRVLGVDYSVSGVGSVSGGTITFAFAPAALSRVVLRRNVGLTRLIDYQYAGDFQSATVNQDFDRLWMSIQDYAQDISVSLRFPPDDPTDATLPDAASRALRIIGFDSDGQLTMVPITDGNAIALTLALASSSLSTQGAGMIGFKGRGVGAVATTVQAALETFDQKPTGGFYVGQGARVNRITDRLFLGPAVEHDGLQNPVDGTWVGDASLSGGIYKYLPDNAVLFGLTTGNGVGAFFAGRASDAKAYGGTLSLPLGSFVYNDDDDPLTNGTSVYGHYVTVLRKAGARGPTHGFELDIANMGANVPLFPNDIFKYGSTSALWIATGGETTNTGSPGTSSVALAILRNDSQATPTSLFDKGILFHATALAGCDGFAGVGHAIDMAKGHQLTWWNNDNEMIGLMRSDGEDKDIAAGLIFSDNGLLIVNAKDDSTQARFDILPSTSNYLRFTPSAAATGPQIMTEGPGAAIDLILNPKGTGLLQFGTYTAGAITQAGYITVKDLAGNVRRLLVG